MGFRSGIRPALAVAALLAAGLFLIAERSPQPGAFAHPERV
ncbi:MAG TPA: hypothetical protein VIJ36_10825 [Thermoanaerobaculia bacterium]